MTDDKKSQKTKLREALESLINEVQNWCDAVERDSSWDGWDRHYKEIKYGALDEARHVLEQTK